MVYWTNITYIFYEPCWIRYNSSNYIEPISTTNPFLTWWSTHWQWNYSHGNPICDQLSLRGVFYVRGLQVHYVHITIIILLHLRTLRRPTLASSRDKYLTKLAICMYGVDFRYNNMSITNIAYNYNYISV